MITDRLLERFPGIPTQEQIRLHLADCERKKRKYKRVSALANARYEMSLEDRKKHSLSQAKNCDLSKDEEIEGLFQSITIRRGERDALWDFMITLDSEITYLESEIECVRPELNTKQEAEMAKG